MSTIFGTIYDEIRAQINALLTTHTELNNPYFLEDDADINYDQSWTISIGPSNNVNRNLCPKVSIRREFIVTLTQRYFAPSRDITARLDSEKTMFNFQLDVIKTLECYNSSSIVKTAYVSDNGLEFLEGDRFGFLVLQTLFEVEYFENL